MPERRSAGSFDRLARGYRALEWLAFGSALEDARFCHLDRLRGCRDILILGEGDGRCVARLAALAPTARIHCVDSSPAMIARASARLRQSGGGERVSFTVADALSLELPPAAYDAVVTFFFLDCFRPEQVAGLVARARAALRPGSLWLFADFALPPRGLRRWRARLWLAILYAFFRWQTKLTARALPPSEALIEAAGFRREAGRDFQRGLIRSVVFIAGPAASPGP